MSKFQIITIFIFILAIIAGVTSFALYKGNSGTSSLPAITIWGTFPANTFNEYVANINSGLTQSMKITYVQKRADSFNSDFVNALALGQGPDAILIPSDMMLAEQNKLTQVPFSAFSQREFMDSYIDEAQIYLDSTGAWAIPFTVDPLVMYWNKDIFNAAGIALYPQYWDELTGTGVKPGLVQKLTVKDSNGNVRKTAVAMGDFTNITNARELLGSLFLQAGNPVTSRDNSGLIYSTLNTSNSTNSISPAVQYFSQFANPTSANYSWNRAMSNDKTVFLAGQSAIYFGFASEILELRAKNPNLNYDVAPLPQLRSGQKAVYGKMFGFSLVRSSANANATYQIISTLILPANLAALSKTMYLPSVRNDVIAQGSTNAYITIFNKAALISKTWLDIDPQISRQIFSNLTQSLISGQKNIDQAIRDAADQYSAVLQQAGN